MYHNDVAPFTGAWIEIPDPFIDPVIFRAVAPFTGAWIEMFVAVRPRFGPIPSHPSRVRGLKYRAISTTEVVIDGRTLHGCVD